MALRVKRDPRVSAHIQLSSGIFVESPVTVEADDHPKPGFLTSLQVAYDDKEQRLVSKSVSVLAVDDTSEVTGADIRAVRVQDLLKQAGLMILTKRSYGTYGEELKLSDMLRDYSENSEKHKKSYTSAADIYLVSTVLNYPPLKTISDILGISQSTATRLVAKAREEGLI